MKKSILEEYQKRVENILTTLNSNQAIVIEGVETSQIRTDNRLAELQGMLEEAQRPIDMSDVGIGVTGSFVRDSRASTMRDSYSDDREGYLLSEYDKRRLDPDEPTANVERVVEEIRQVREERRRAQEEAIRAEMQDLIDEQARIESVREAQAEKALVSMQLQEEKDSIASEIEAKRAKIEEEKNRADKALGEMKVHKATLALYKDLKSRVYTVASAEVQKCEERARSAETRIASLNKRIERLQQESGDIEALLQSMDEKTKEFSEQEDEMWEEYRAEQAKDEEKKERDMEYGWAQHDLEEKRAEMREKTLEEKEKASEEQVIEQYADGLNPEEDFSKYDNWKPSTTVDNPQKPQKLQKPEATQPPKPDAQKPKDPPQQAPEANKMKNAKIKTVGLTIEANGKPRYYAIVEDDKGQPMTLMGSQKSGFEEIPAMTTELSEELFRKGVNQADKYYDVGLDEFLVELDTILGRIERGANGKMQAIDREAYVKMIAQKNMVTGKTPLPFEVSYDLSNLYQMPKTTMGTERLNQIKRAAKANKNKGLADYEKAPGFFKRIIKALTTRSLPAGEQKAEQQVGRIELEDLRELESKEEILCSQYRHLYRDGFDASKIPELTPEEAAIVQQDFEKTSIEREDALSKFRQWNRLERAEAERQQKRTIGDRIKDLPTRIAYGKRDEMVSGTYISFRTKKEEKPKELDDPFLDL